MPRRTDLEQIIWGGCKLYGLVLGPAVKKHEGWGTGLTGLIWLGIRTNVEVLWKRSWTSGFQILHRICWPSDEMLPSRVRPSSLMINNTLGILRISTTYCLQRCSVFLAVGTAFIYLVQPQGPNIYIHFDKLTLLRGVHLRKLTHSLTHPPI